MAPSKPRPMPFDDSRSEASSTKEKLAIVQTTVGKGRRMASGLGPGNSLRDSTSAAVVNASSTVANGAVQDSSTGIQWSTMDVDTLHTYRQAYKMNTPTAFASSYNQIILSRSAIGRLSPTMARRKDERRQNKDHLATVVRKHFNGLGIQENDVIVEFLYKVKFQDKAFRMRFTPQRTK